MPPPQTIALPPSALAAGVPPDQMPRVWAVPPAVTSTGDEAVELCRMAGLYLDPWQEFELRASLGQRADGKWAAFEVGLVCARQNGKDEILIARELAELFLLRDPLLGKPSLTIHSAHEFDTAMEHFRRLRDVIEATPEFYRRLPKTRNHGIKEGNGKESIELADGTRLKLKARTKGAGRGLTGDLVVLNEAMDLPFGSMAALLPTLAARPNAQVIYAGSAVDQELHEHGLTLAGVRERGHEGAANLAYFEHSPDFPHPSEVSDEAAADPDTWRQGNPAMGIRISEEYISKEREALDPRSFAVERLCVGDWPATSADAAQIIPVETWAGGLDPHSDAEDPIAVAYDVTPDRDFASIGWAGYRPDGRIHVEVTEHRRFGSWLAPRLTDFVGRQGPSDVVFDLKGPAASLTDDLQFKPEPFGLGPKELAEACAMFFDLCEQDGIRHTGQQELQSALAGASIKDYGDMWRWARRNSTHDITPLIVVTLAVWALKKRPSRKEFFLAIGGEVFKPGEPDGDEGNS